jgi:ATP-dependent helicase/DNAse subunit B
MKFITYSKLRGRVFDIKEDVETLSSFIYFIHQKNSTKVEISNVESKYIIKNIIKNLKLNFFDYLKESQKTLQDLVTFIIDVKRNEVNIDDLEFDEIKKEELKIIFNEYNSFLEKNNLSDIADVEKFSLDYISNNNFNEVVLDNFEYKDIHFFASKLQKKIYQKLDGEIKEENITKKNNFIKEIECFNEFDEAVKTLKQIKELLNNGEKEENIKIFVSNIDKYFPILETLSFEYKINLYSTKGIPIARYEDGKKRIKSKATYLYEKLKKYGVTKKEIEEDLIKSETILIRKGIEVTETNQIFVYKDIKHLFFVGANINDFPPEREKNIFYVKDFEEKFFKNNIFKSSKAIVDRMNNISDNLYIIYQKDKKSTLVGKYPEINEFIFHPQASKLEKKKKEKLSLKRDKLSASQINTYNKCPRRYFYQYILKINPPKEEVEEMDIMLQGEIIHKCFEIYVKNIDKNLDADELIEAAYNDDIRISRGSNERGYFWRRNR